MSGLTSISVNSIDFGDLWVPQEQRDAVSSIPVYTPDKPLDKQIELWREWSARIRFIYQINSPKPQIRQVTT